MSIDTQKKNEAILQQIKICCEAIEDKKGENIVVLQMPNDASIASYFITVTIVLLLHVLLTYSFFLKF